LSSQLGRPEVDRPMSFIEVESRSSDSTVEEVIQSLLPLDLNQPAKTVNRVTLGGRTIFHRSVDHA